MDNKHSKENKNPPEKIWFESLNPSTETPVATFEVSTERELQKICSAAAKALKSWSATPLPKRKEHIYSFVEILKKRRDKIARSITQECGKSLTESYEEVDSVTSVTDQLLDITDSHIHPLGALLISTPWSFPFKFPALKVIPALLTGNTVVLKPAVLTPYCAAELVQLFRDSTLPAGVLDLVIGSSRYTATPLLSSPFLDSVFYTCSYATSSRIVSIHPVTIESGGKNALIVTEPCSLTDTVKDALQSSYAFAGQRYTCCDNIFVHDSLFDEFLSLFIEGVRRLRVGDGMSPNTDVPPLVNAYHRTNVHNTVKRAVDGGALLHCGGEIPERKGFFYLPAVLTKVNPQMDIFSQEVYGPTAAILSYHSLDEVVKMVNAIEYTLVVSVYSSQKSNLDMLKKSIKARAFVVNAPTIQEEYFLPRLKRPDELPPADILKRVIDQFSSPAQVAR